MNNGDLFLNDSFDNLSLTNIDNLINGHGKTSQNSGSASANNNKVYRNPTEIYYDKEDISFNDSLFLNESIKLPSPQKEITKTQNVSQNIKKKGFCSDFKLRTKYQEFYGTNKNIPSINHNNNEKTLHLNYSTNPLKKNVLLEVNNFETTAYLKNPENCDFSQKVLEQPEQLLSDKKYIDMVSKHPHIEKNGLTKENYLDLEKTYNEVNLDLKNLKLSSWGFPEAVLEKYHSRKINTMFPWQVECLTKSNILNDLSNLVYSAPTSAGKTLVAEILAIKTILERHKKVIFILPFVSIVREKMYYFQDILGSSGVRVEGFMGAYNPPGGFQSVQFAICTIEKANSLINRLLDEGNLSEIGAVLVDEMHLIGDPHRGYMLELLLTKLKYISKKDNNVQIQIIGMSATLPNLKDLANWLNAEFYTTSFRPIPLHEQAHVCGEIYDKNLKLVRKLNPLSELGTDTDNILQLCLETIRDSCSVLIFCPTKNWCENLAQQISTAFYKFGKSSSSTGELLRSQLNTELITELLQQLKYCPVGLDDVIRKTVSFGVAYHHAGLTMDERDIIEGAFRSSAVRVLIATSTLSSGVNLPARRVIIRSAHFHGKPIDTLSYRQMIGRAGRLGKDSVGESFLICQKKDYQIAKELMSAELHPVESCLEGEGKLKRAILEVIASGVASTPNDVELFANCTLLASTAAKQFGFLDKRNPIHDALTFLISNEFIRFQKADDNATIYVPTSLGKACLSASIPPDEGLTLFTELEKARQCLVLETELHLIYLVTPYSACNSWGNIDWMFYLDLWEKLPASMKRVGELVGVRESYIVNGTRGKIVTTTNKLYQQFLVHRRFFVALALHDLVNEKPLNEVCAKFNCNRGMLQSLQQSSSSFAGMVTSFSRQLGWNSMEILLSQFQDRMQFGVSRDLLDLMRLPELNGKMARTLYNSGIETLIQLANSNIDIVENFLHKALPFERLKERDGESKFDNYQRNKIRRVWITGKDGLTEREAAEMLVKDARKYLKTELGLVDAKWEGHISDSQNDIKQSSNEGQLNSNNKQISAEEHKREDTILADLGINHKNKNLEESSESICLSSSNDTSALLLALNISNNSGNVSTKSENGVVILDTVKTTVNSQVLKAAKCINFRGDKNKNNFHYKLNENCNMASECSDPHISPQSSKLSNSLQNKASYNRSASISKKVEVSHILMSNSPVELNISDSSIFSPSGNKEILSSISSSQSFLEDSFTLQLSDESPKNLKITFENGIGDTSDLLDDSILLDKAFSSSLKIEDKLNNFSSGSSEDLFNSSLIDESKAELVLGKRGRKSIDGVSAFEETPSKKKKFQNCDIYSKDAYSRGQLIVNNAEFSKIIIVDVCKSKVLFETFAKEVIQKNALSISLACSMVNTERPVIGLNIVSEDIVCFKAEEKFTYKNRKVDGLSVTWEGKTIYYLSLENKECQGKIIQLFKTIFNNTNLSLKIFDSKAQLKVLMQCFDLSFNCTIEDPKVADWILEPEAKEKNLHAMTIAYCPEATALAQLAGSCKGVGSVALDLNSSVESRIRASVETIVTWHLTSILKDRLKKVNPGFIDAYETEMKSVPCVTRVEVTGMSVSKDALQKLEDSLRCLLSAIEKKAYSLAGRRFNFISSSDVAKVVGAFKGKKVTMRKTVLQQNEHPISELVIQWRKINCTLTKMICPLLREVDNERIYPRHIMHTATGRITMHDPNLQSIPKDFQVSNPMNKKTVNISCRSAFSAPESYCMLSADYCQLELRILAHLSEDTILRAVMKKPGDVFKLLAAKWNKASEDQVDETMRQNTKHLCYAVIYGMGSKALSDLLSVPEEEAVVFMETFRNTYPGIKKYIQTTIEKCKKYGYVETITGRRRYLPHINESDNSLKGQAERQAVNTTVQGSAADIAKTAMVLIDEKLHEKFGKAKNKPKLSLHLHDELLYEVPAKHVRKVAKIMKNCMENAVKLSVPLPVKLKTGPSWGQLSEYNL